MFCNRPRQGGNTNAAASAQLCSHSSSRGRHGQLGQQRLGGGRAAPEAASAGGPAHRVFVRLKQDVKEARALQACGASFLDPQLLAWRAREAEERLEAEDQSFQREVLEALRAYHAGERRRLRGLGGGLLDLEAEVFKPARLERTVQHLEFAAGSLRRQGLPRRARLLLWLFLNQEHHRLALGENAADTIVRMTRDLRRARR